MSLPALSRRFVLRRALVLLAGVVTVAGGQASRLEKRPFKIPASPAPEALAEFIRQSGFQVLFDFDAIRGINTHEVSGHLDPTEVLARMLEGSGLTFEFINERTVSVRPHPPLAIPVAQPSPEP